MSLARNMSRINVDNNGYVQPSSLAIVDGSLISSKIPASAFPTGSVIQMVSTLYRNYNSVAISTAWTEVPGLALSITPISTSSRIKVDIRWFGETQEAWNSVFGITRNGSLINIPTDTGNRNPALSIPIQTYVSDDNNSTPETAFITTIDSPATTATLTYRLVCRTYNTGKTLVTGKVFDTGVLGSNYEQGSCEVILTEYA